MLLSASRSIQSWWIPKSCMSCWLTAPKSPSVVWLWWNPSRRPFATPNKSRALYSIAAGGSRENSSEDLVVSWNRYRRGYGDAGAGAPGHRQNTSRDRTRSLRSGDRQSLSAAAPESSLQGDHDCPRYLLRSGP